MKRHVKKLANTIPALIITMVLSWIVFGLVFASLESEYGWFDGLYLGTVVQSTLGFGDVLPTHWYTKLWVMLYVWFCIYFILPAAIFHVAELVLEDPDEVTDSDLARIEAKLDALLEMRKST